MNKVLILQKELEKKMNERIRIDDNDKLEKKITLEISNLERRINKLLDKTDLIKWAENLLIYRNSEGSFELDKFSLHLYVDLSINKKESINSSCIYKKILRICYEDYMQTQIEFYLTNNNEILLIKPINYIGYYTKRIGNTFERCGYTYSVSRNNALYYKKL